jgi:hypothetical protein
MLSACSELTIPQCIIMHGILLISDINNFIGHLHAEFLILYMADKVLSSDIDIDRATLAAERPNGASRCLDG